MTERNEKKQDAPTGRTKPPPLPARPASTRPRTLPPPLPPKRASEARADSAEIDAPILELDLLPDRDSRPSIPTRTAPPPSNRPPSNRPATELEKMLSAHVTAIEATLRPTPPFAVRARRIARNVGLAAAAVAFGMLVSQLTWSRAEAPPPVAGAPEHEPAPIDTTDENDAVAQEEANAAAARAAAKANEAPAMPVGSELETVATISKSDVMIDEKSETVADAPVKLPKPELAAKAASAAAPVVATPKPARPSEPALRGSNPTSHDAIDEDVELEPQPTREQVLKAMESVRGAIEKCASGKHGTVHVDVSVASSGRVRSAIIDGDFVGSPEGSCIALAVRKARFPRFTDDSFSVRYPYRF